MVDICDRTFTFALDIVTLTRSLDPKDNAARVFTRQLLRSGTSIGANIEEGQGAQSRADFIAKYHISLKEARETYYWLRLIKATGMVPASQIESILSECNEIISILVTILKKAKHNA